MKKTGYQLIILLILIVCLSNIAAKKNSPATAALQASTFIQPDTAEQLSSTFFNFQDTLRKKPLLKTIKKDSTTPAPKSTSFIKKVFAAFKFKKNASFNSQDTLRKKPLLKTIKKDSTAPATKSTNFIKNLFAAFKFKKNAQANEQLRVKAFLETLRIDTNLTVSMENIRLLDTALSRSDSSINSVIRQIQLIKGKLKTNNASLQTQLNKSAGGLANEKIKIDAGLAKLAATMNSIISYNAIKDPEAKINRINFINTARDSSNVVHTKNDTLTDPETKKTSIVTNKFQIKVKNKAEVYGIYDIATLHHLNTSLFRQLDYLFLNTIPIVVNDISKIDRAAELIKTTEDYLAEALKSDCKIGLSFKIALYDTVSLNKLWTSQKLFTRNTLVLLSTIHASAVNIVFDSLPPTMEGKYVRFLKDLSEILRVQTPAIKLMVTIPANNKEFDFPLQQIIAYADRIIIDFSRNYTPQLPAPMAPLLGDQQFTIQSTVSRYQAQQVPLNKIIIQLPYSGATWAFSKTFISRFLDYSDYSEIRKKYEDHFHFYYKHYNDDSTFVMMDLLDDIVNGAPAASITVMSASGKTDTLPFLRTFYDDATTLGKKYQFVETNKLAGVAVNHLGADSGYTDLWNEMTYQFADTVTENLPATILAKQTRNNLGTLERWSRYFTLFKYILDNPCETCFENMKDTAKLRLFHQYMLDLRIDSMLTQENNRLIANQKDTFRSHFEFINYILTNLLETVTWIILALLVLLIAVYLYKNKYSGDGWKGRKAVGYLGILLSFLLVISFFSYLFSSNTIPYFGAVTSVNSGYSKDYVNSAGVNDQISKKDDSYCNSDQSDCINMPLITLLAIVITTLFIGFVITRYLVITVVKQKDIP